MAVNFLLDGGLTAFGVAVSFWLVNPAAPWPSPVSLPLAGAIAIWLIGVPFGLSRLRWRHVSFHDLAVIAAAGGGWR
ncbi:MAG TPA: hypothetical protein PLY97_03520 [Acidocella sp.]|nr:hypothetical protein [Acidocella sp.]